MKYKIFDRDSFFVRQDSEKVFTLLIKETGFQVYLNQVGNFIFELLQKYEDTDLVLHDLYSNFPNIDKKTIKIDFEDVFGLMSMYRVVCVDDNSKEASYTQTPLIKFAGDGDYKRLAKFMKSTKLLHSVSMSSFLNLKDLTPIGLRYSSFHNTNYFCCAYDDNGEILGVISIQPSVRGSTVLVVDGMLFFHRLRDDEVVGICTNLMKFVNRKFEKLTKFRFAIFDNNELCSNKKFLLFLQKIGFEKEVELKKENGNATLFMYAKYINNELQG